MRYKIELAYEGTHFGGWQVQNNTITVQGEIDKALSQVCNQKIETMGCGRTDAGVHASYFVAHFDGPENIPQDLAIRLNKMLPNSIGIKKIVAVNEDFHSRFSATQREYHYHIHRSKNPFTTNTSWWLATELNVAAMNQCAAAIVGKHPFPAFCKGEIPNGNPMCEVFIAEWTITEAGYTFQIQANRFLRNMVRALVGTMVEVGQGKISPADFEAIFVGGSRSEAGASAPAQGLHLTDVKYPTAIAEGNPKG
jgi:tRNA pseudouridine38-40 synthase